MIHYVPSKSASLNINLLQIWVARYLPDLGKIPPHLRKYFKARVTAVSSPAARQLTQAKLMRTLAAQCTLAGVEAQQLMGDAEIPIQTSDVEEISIQIMAIYMHLIDSYVKDFLFLPVLDYIETIDTEKSKQTVALRILPAFNRGMNTLEPLLVELQKMLQKYDNPRGIGYLTTQLHFSRRRFLGQLDAYEQLWLSPYLQLVEERVCMPWKRVCAAANRYSVNWRLAVAIVTKMMPMMESISKAVYQRAIQTYPEHRSRQGRIHSGTVEASSLRDLSMFQTYIWLALLEGNISVIEQELLPLCLMVFPYSQVDWSLVNHGIEWLGDEISMHLNEQEKILFTDHIEPIKTLFAQATLV